MSLLIVLAIVAAFYILRPKVTIAPTVEAPPVIQEFPLGKRPDYAPGETFHHKETGEKVEVVQSPEIVDGEYAIMWPSGEVGHIHETSLREFFE